jgi:hypothetical protein
VLPALMIRAHNVAPRQVGNGWGCPSLERAASACGRSPFVCAESKLPSLGPACHLSPSCRPDVLPACRLLERQHGTEYECATHRDVIKALTTISYAL